jgi:hypothetical protein
MSLKDDISRPQFEPSGPIAIASGWLNAILEEDKLERAWALTHPAFRRKAVRAWIAANRGHVLVMTRDLADLEEALVKVAFDDPLWDAYAETQLREFREAWQDIDMSRRGWAGDPRPIGPNRELVLLVDIDDPNIVDKDDRHIVEEEALIRALGIVLEHVDEDDLDPGITIAFDNAEGDRIENHWRVVDLYEGDQPLPESSNS